ncbi:MAG: hypothetical protein J6U20_03440 [Fibrobacter sp.]|nr:hypothetical protein [Fibrobacter sp.]
MTKTKYTTLLICLMGFIATSLTACCDDCSDSCSETTTGTNKLSSVQKKVGGFKKGKSTHYIHSDGFEFDLTVTKDTNYFVTYSGYCIEIDKELRKRKMTSKDPAMSVDVELLADGDLFATLSISYDGTVYQFNLDSAAQVFDEEWHVELRDTITFNGTVYDSVFVVQDNNSSFIYDEETKRYRDRAPSTNSAHLYFSLKKGILKFETVDGKSFTIKEGE